MRAELRAARRALDASALARAASAVHAASGSLEALTLARAVAGYAACDGEIDVAAILADARARGAATFLPRRRAAAPLELVAVDGAAALVRTGAGAIPEPDGPACDVHALPVPGVLLAPALALDRRGFRLGRGGGDYDRLLPLLRARGWTIVGICHATQLRDAVPVEPHDQPVDAILTDAGLVLPRR